MIIDRPKPDPATADAATLRAILELFVWLGYSWNVERGIVITPRGTTQIVPKRD